MKSPWQILDISPTQDSKEVKRAYAKRLKEDRASEDADKFQELRWAYEAALEWFENPEIYESTSEPLQEPQNDFEDLAESILRAENPVGAFREAVVSPELIPIDFARMLELALAKSFDAGKPNPMEALGIFAEVASYYRWDDVQHDIHVWSEIGEASILATGAWRCKQTLSQVADGTLKEKRVIRTAAKVLTGASDPNLISRKAVIKSIPTLRSRFGDGWDWLLVLDCSDYDFRVELIQELKYRRSEPAYSALAWAIGMVVGAFFFMIIGKFVRYLYLTARIEWLYRKPSVTES
jgi:hypothetical protein